jgi:hypothetical protein
MAVSAISASSLTVPLECQVMAEYWQEKRIDHKHVACAWGLVLVVLAVMLVITSLTAPGCAPDREVAASNCADGKMVQRATSERQP